MAGATLNRAGAGLDFPFIDPLRAVIFGRSCPRLLAPFDPSLSLAAQHALEQLGVEVRLGANVTDCDCSGVSLGSERLQTRTIIWAAGVKASPVAEWLAVDSDRAGRVKVNCDLSVPGHPDIFVIGDAAAANGPGGKTLTGVAPVAWQGAVANSCRRAPRARCSRCSATAIRPWPRSTRSAVSNSARKVSGCRHGSWSFTILFLIGFAIGWRYSQLEPHYLPTGLIDHWHFRLSHRRRNACRDNGAADGADARSGRGSKNDPGHRYSAATAGPEPQFRHHDRYPKPRRSL